MTGYSISQLKEFPMVLGGVFEESGFMAYHFYNKFRPNICQVSSAKVAKIIKVMEGCYRDANICLDNRLFQLAENK
jgi:UDP-N-acetyl-D-mannosaminuronate dehydrogenase